MSPTSLLLLLCGLQAAVGSSKLGCLHDVIHDISDAVAANHTDHLKEELHLAETQTHLHRLDESVQYLRELIGNCCGGPRTTIRVDQNEVDSDKPGERRRIDCNGDGKKDMMLVGLGDDNGFEDLDSVKCQRYPDIHLGVGVDHDVHRSSDDTFQLCPAGHVVSAFASNYGDWMEHVTRMTCSPVIGAVVTDHCEDIVVTPDMAAGYLDADVPWPAQCKDLSPYANVLVGIIHNEEKNPRWVSLRCCQLHRPLH